ncbi:PREDICTED: uncharacterized protein LOC108365628 [Rhagoletis zephyria]|uniref:uncharacterized protein LOC108365628 n=1 Tax=Rhagoletis zephyria TaxID=28612 RepID=UPI0008118AF0|nr:PREDICTED: uncharacterized protein LOC108365628 [Rhagoletis zephyria]
MIVALKSEMIVYRPSSRAEYGSRSAGGVLFCVETGRLYQRKPKYEDLDVCFTRSVRGNNLLTINGKPYTLNRRIKDVCYWECVKLRCKYTKCTARVITKYDQIASLRGDHNHL